MKLPSNIPPHAELVHDGVIFQVYQWQQQLFDGSYTTFEAARREPVVTVIPVIGDKIVILHEEQPAHEPRISFPGGRIDPNEDIFDAAKRELHEETGMVFKNLKLVMVEDIGSGKFDWWAFRFIATGLEQTDEPHIDPGEKIRVEQVSFDIAHGLAQDNHSMSHLVMAHVTSLDELISLPALDPNNITGATQLPRKS